jgi:hypothetical protein
VHEKAAQNAVEPGKIVFFPKLRDLRPDHRKHFSRAIIEPALELFFAENVPAFRAQSRIMNDHFAQEL